MCRDENRSGMLWNYNQGGVSVFCQGSTLARGVDVEFYHLLFAYSTNFVNPYWYAVNRLAEKEKDTARAAFAQSVIDNMMIDETTNAILRISPTQKKNDGMPRLVFLQEKDEWKVRGGIISRMVKLTSNISQIYNLLRGIVQNAYGVLLTPPKGYSEQDCGISVGTYTSEIPENAPKLTMEDFIRELRKDPASLSDPLESVPAGLISQTREIILKDLRRRKKEGKRISEEALCRWVVPRLSKRVPDQTKEFVVKRVIEILIREGYVGRERNLNGDPIRSLNKPYEALALPTGMKGPFDGSPPPSLIDTDTGGGT